MTPLVAAWSSLRLADASSSVALSFSPASTASRNPRTAVRSDDLTDWLRSRARSLVRMRFSCDLMLATRVSSFVNLKVDLVWSFPECPATGSDCSGYQFGYESPKVDLTGLPKR